MTLTSRHCDVRSVRWYSEGMGFKWAARLGGVWCLAAVAVMASLPGCKPTIESVSKDFCEWTCRCADDPPQYCDGEVQSCETQMEDSIRATFDDNDASQECRDAYLEFFDCVSNQPCDAAPSACEKENTRYGYYCHFY